MDVRADRYTDVDEEVQGSNLVTSKSSGGSGGQLNIRTSHIQPPLDSVSGYPTVISPLSSARPDTLPAKQKAPHAGVQRSIRQQDGEHDDGVFFTAGTLPRVNAQPRIQKAMPASTKPDPPTKPVRSILKRDATNGDRRVEEEDRRREEKEPSEWEKVEREKTEREIEALQDELVRLRNETLRARQQHAQQIRRAEALISGADRMQRTILSTHNVLESRRTSDQDLQRRAFDQELQGLAEDAQKNAKASGTSTSPIATPRSQRASSPQRTEVQPQWLSVGARVRLQGLLSGKEYNGMYGTVVAPPAEGRVRVMLDTHAPSGKQFSLKLANVVPLADDTASAVQGPQNADTRSSANHSPRKRTAI